MVAAHSSLDEGANSSSLCLMQLNQKLGWWFGFGGV